MKNLITIILIALISISCKEDQKVEKEISTEVVKSEDNTIIKVKEKKSVEKTNSKNIELDSVWVHKTFKDTPLTSDSGEMYTGFKSTVYGITSQTINNKKLNTYVKKIDVNDGSLSEVYAALLSENEKELYDIKWIGNIGQIAECKMDTEIDSNDKGLLAKYSFLCYDCYDEILDKEFMNNKITLSKIKVSKNKLIVERDEITSRTEVK